MSRSIDRSSNRTPPLISHEERAAGARGVASPMTRRLANGKPKPPPGITRIGRAPPRLGPPGRLQHGRFIRGPSHDPPRQARGDPPGIPIDWGGCSLDTYGRSSGPIPHLGTSRHGDPPLFKATTGPPGRLQHGRFIRGPSHGPPRKARGDPPGKGMVARGCDPPRARAGPFTANRRGPPGSFATDSSLSAERRRERIPAARPETARQDAARKSTTTKSRKITPWL